MKKCYDENTFKRIQLSLLTNQNQVNHKESTPPLISPLSRGGEDWVWKTFGHLQVKSILQKQLQSQKFPHAYLFFGSDSLGKKTLALEFAQKVLQTDRLETHPDFQLLDTEGVLLIDMLLDFIAKLNFKPFLARKRIAIINNAQNLNLQSSNALLKTLEEPADSIIVILVANRQLLPTIISRCQVLNFSPLSPDKLKEFAKALKLDTRTKNQIFNFCFGLPGRLVNLVSNPVLLEQEEELIEQFKKVQLGRLSDRLLAIAKYAALEVYELEKIFITWFYWQLDQLKTNPQFFSKVEALSEAILGLKMNKNKKLVLQGLFLKI